MKEIEEILWRNTVDGVTDLCRIAGIKSKGIKADKIDALLNFFENENWIKETFEQLSPYEKEMMTCLIQNNYHPSYDEIKQIIMKYDKKNIWYFGDSYFDRKSKVQLFYLGSGTIPLIFRKELNKLVEPLKFKITTLDNIDPENFFANIVGREERVGDFDEFIKFINVNKIRVTKAKKEMPKSSLIKIHNLLGYTDVLMEEEIDFQSIHSIEDTTVSMGIVNLLQNSGLIKIKNELFILDKKNCEEYQQLNRIEKVQYLLDGYVDDKKNNINEGNRIRRANFKFQVSTPKLGEVRKMILNYLKICPLNCWLSMDDLKQWIRIHDYKFLRPYLGEVLVKDDYYGSYYQQASHDELENSFIDIVFMGYLATMGIVDVNMTYEIDDYDREFLRIACFKITELGSYVLGMAKNEKQEQEEKKFEVTDTFKIKVPNNSLKLKFELYFDRFLTKHKGESLVYDLNFEGMVKALSLGIDLSEIKEYIVENAENQIPLNVEKQLEKWIVNSKKIRIKTITILETDNEEASDIILNQDYKQCIDSVKNNVIVLKSNKIDTMKKTLNKNGKFWI